MREYAKNYAKSLFAKRKLRDYEEHTVQYIVRATSILENEVKSAGLSFDTREKARQYKKILKESTLRLDAKIYRRELIDAFIMSESEVW